MQAPIFITGFVLLVLGFGFFISYVSRRLNGKISPQLYSVIEAILIAGILLGVVGLFQPWTIQAYGIGFHLLLVSVLAFTVWSHVTPRAREVRNVKREA